MTGVRRARGLRLRCPRRTGGDDEQSFDGRARSPGGEGSADAADDCADGGGVRVGVVGGRAGGFGVGGDTVWRRRRVLAVGRDRDLHLLVHGLAGHVRGSCWRRVGGRDRGRRARRQRDLRLWLLRRGGGSRDRDRGPAIRHRHAVRGGRRYRPGGRRARVQRRRVRRVCWWRWRRLRRAHRVS